MKKDRQANENEEITTGDEPRLNRREFISGLGKWSKIVIGVALAGSALTASEREAEAYRTAWANRGGGGGWVNRYGGGGAWANRGGGSAGWVNRYGSAGAWANHGSAAGWVNRAGGGGTWANHGGGGGWVNRW